MTKRIGRFDIVEPIGQGLSGTVYKGFDPTTGRNVTVETIALDGLGNDAAREQALKAARDAGVLSHPNIALILDVGSDGDVVYVVREFIDGRSLADHIADGAPFQPAALLPGLDQIADALDYGHRRGVVHGNFEPAHVIVSSLGQVKITGYGSARIASKAAQSAHALDGSPEYMAPEKIRGEAVGPRSDVYAFGAMVYELLTGRAPFASDSVITTIYKAVNEAPVAPRELAPDLSPRVDALVLKSLAKSPTDRFENCRQFVDGLRAILRPDEAPATAPAEAAAPRFCDQCGTTLRPKDDVCYRCGAAPESKPVARQSPAAPVPVPVVEPPPPAPRAVQPVQPIESAVVPPAPVSAPEPRVTQAPMPRPAPPPLPLSTQQQPAVSNTTLQPAPPIGRSSDVVKQPAVTPPPVAPAPPVARVTPPPPVRTPPPVEREVPKTEVAPVPVAPPPPSAPAIPKTEVAPAPDIAAFDGSRPRGLPPPLSGYAESLGEDLPAPGAVIDAAPKKPSVLAAMLPWIVLLLILTAFAAVGFWIAPKIIKPVPAPQPQTSSVVALWTVDAGTRA